MKNRTLAGILSRFPLEVESFRNGADMDNRLYEALYEHYRSSGEMPYGTAKGRDGDPYVWVADRLEAELGV